MAVRTVPIVYRILEVLDVDHGHWCQHCLPPSAAVITLASQATIAGIDGPLKLSTGIRCLERHGWLITGV